MVRDDVHIRSILARVEAYGKVKGVLGIGLLHRDVRRFQIGVQFLQVFFRRVGDDFQFFLRFPEAEPCGHGGPQTLASAGVGHHDALYIFDDIAAYDQVRPVRHAAERVPRERCGVGDGDRLGTAHGRNQFFPEDVKEAVIDVLFHE